MSSNPLSLISNAKKIHLTGYKGVAMASIAQIFADLGKDLSGSDVAEDFVTEKVLKQLSIKSFEGFSADHISPDTQLLVFTAAHQGPKNPEVLAAKEKGIPVLSQAEALAALFNEKQGIAVCGVGGKSTTSAMIAWIFSKLNKPISYSVGVGSINGLPKTGQWAEESEYFVAEADEYVVDPNAPKEGKEITPRFSYLKPFITVCTSLEFDHPDVYRDFDHTVAVFKKFFLQTKHNGYLIVKGNQGVLWDLAEEVKQERPDLNLLVFQDSTTVSPINHDSPDLITGPVETTGEEATAVLYNQTFKDEESKHNITVSVGGKHNIINATAAVLASKAAGIPVSESVTAISDFRSTSRRFEFIGEKNGVLYFDDYAHHPREVAMMSMAIQQMYRDKKVYVVFQPHTYSRTKALFDEFVAAFKYIEHVIILPIFASAREKDDPTVSAEKLRDRIWFESPEYDIQYMSSLDELSTFCSQLPEGSVVITLGAGDIYKVHDKIK